MTEKNGELPKGWKWVKLGEVCQLVSGSTPSSTVTEFWNGDITWITPTDLGRLNSFFINNSERKITQEGYKSCNTALIPVNSVVMSSRAPIGHLGIAKVPLCTNQGCKSFVTTNAINFEFLFFVLKKAVPELKLLGSGSTFAEISKSQLEIFEIPLPPLPEQKRIVAILNEQMAAVEKARTAAEAQLQAAKTLPAAYLREVFDSPEAQKWERKKLGEVCKIVAPLVDPKVPEYGILPHVNGENIESGTCRLTYLNTAFEEGMTSGKYLFDSGDILYTKLRPYLRKVAVVDFQGLCSADTYPIKVDSKYLDNQFTGWLLVSDTFTNYANEASARARMPKLNREQLFAWETPIPPIHEQKAMAEKLNRKIDEVKSLCETLQDQLNTIKQLPAALLRQAFNGEL